MEQISGEKSFEGQLKFVAENKAMNEDSEVGNNPNIFVTLNIDGGGKRAKPSKTDEEELSPKTKPKNRIQKQSQNPKQIQESESFVVYAPVAHDSDSEFIKNIITTREFSIEKWVEGLSIDEISSLESMVMNGNAAQGKLLYIIKPYMTLIPQFATLEECF